MRDMAARVILKKGKEQSLLRFHPWVFSGAIQTIQGEPSEGDVVEVYTFDGLFLAAGHYESGSIAVRVLTFIREPIDASWWKQRIESAFQVRKLLGLTDCEETTCYRLVHGEGDNLSGLIVDVYGQTAVVQCHSVGMYRSRQEIARALTAVCTGLTAVYDKSSQTVPRNRNIAVQDGYLFGNVDNKENIVMENGHKFLVNWEEGQKTGFFIDQRFNRSLVERYAKGRHVLNTFCYTGGFSVCALAGGAKSVCSIDASESAVALAARNVTLNFGPDAPHETVAADAVEYLKTMDEKYDLVILDPPAFAKHHRITDQALQGYKRINARALSKMGSGSILFTFSCSQAISKEQFRTVVFTAAAIAGKRVRILHQLTQPSDHPINIYHPEGEYLKGLVLYVE